LIASFVTSCGHTTRSIARRDYDAGDAPVGDLHQAADRDEPADVGIAPSA
jgi:hypothetical protein